MTIPNIVIWGINQFIYEFETSGGLQMGLKKGRDIQKRPLYVPEVFVFRVSFPPLFFLNR